MNTYILLAIMILHFLGDWILQPRKIANQKKTNPLALFIHMAFNVALYLMLSAAILVTHPSEPGVTLVLWFLINFVSHGIIDYFIPYGNTERQMITWTAIDQILHISILFITTEKLIFI